MHFNSYKAVSWQLFVFCAYLSYEKVSIKNIIFRAFCRHNKIKIRVHAHIWAYVYSTQLCHFWSNHEIFIYVCPRDYFLGGWVAYDEI